MDTPAHSIFLYPPPRFLSANKSIVCMVDDGDVHLFSPSPNISKSMAHAPRLGATPNLPLYWSYPTFPNILSVPSEGAFIPLVHGNDEEDTTKQLHFLVRCPLFEVYKTTFVPFILLSRGQMTNGESNVSPRVYLLPHHIIYEESCPRLSTF